MGEHSPRRVGGSLSALDDFLAHYFASQPVTATFTGRHEYDHELPDWSMAGRAREMARLRVLREQLDAEHPLPSADLGALRADAAGLDAELARANIDVRLAEDASGHFLARNPALWTGEAIFGVVSLMIRDFAPAADRVDAIEARLARVPEFLETMRTALSEPVPERWRARAVRECATARVLCTDALDAWCDQASDIPASARTRLTRAGSAAAVAFDGAAQWLTTRPAADAAAYSAGGDLIDVLLRRGHFCAESPRALLTRAAEAMAREAAALADQVTAAGFANWAAASAAIAADHPSVEDYLPTFQQRWDAVRDAARRADAVTWPDWPIRYVPIPAWARAVQPSLYWLFYRSPAPFDPYSVYEYLVQPIDASMPTAEQAQRLSAWNHATIMLNHVVHHGGIGHHVQNWHATHRSTSRIGRIAAVDAASRIGMFPGGSMAEGWACYATQLAEELGCLNPLEALSEQHTRVRLLARAIVDLRLHLGDWTFTECVQYYQSVVGMSADMAAAETTKNSMFPATALMYWLGTQGILDLRAAHRAHAGAAFSLRAFHDELLGRGAIPVCLAAQLMAVRA